MLREPIKLEMAVSVHDSGRIKEADFLKGLAILAVLLVHTSWNFIKADELNEVVISNAFINTFARFAVPLFIFVSGLVLSHKYFHSLDRNSFYSKRIKSILPPYVLFSLFYMLCKTAYLSRFPDAREVIINWITGGYGYLWFLVLIMQLYIIFPLLINIYKKFSLKSGYVLAAAFLIELTWAIADLGIPKEFLFPSGIFYFALGIYAYDHAISFNLKSKISYAMIPSIILIALSISYRQILGIIYYGGFENIPIKHPTSSIISSVVLYALIIILLYSMAANINDNKSLITTIICSIGIYSFGIFLVHFFYQQLITLLLIKIGVTFNDGLFYIILFTAMLVLSYATCYIIGRSPFGKYVIGFKPAEISS